MLQKFNTLVRLLIVGLLIYPLPIAMADHVPTQAPYGTNASNDVNAGTFTIGILSSDGFEDSPPESYTIFFSQSSGVTETNSFCVTTSFGHSTNTWQYHTFSLDNLKYYFNDPAGTNIYYRVRSNNITDYSFSTLTDQNTWNLYAGSPFDYNQTNWSAPTGTNACDDPKILDGIGDPSNLTTSANLHDGSITIDWDSALDRYEYSAERYAIGFDKANPPMYGIATGNVGDSNALNTEYTFSKSYLQSALSATVGDTIYFKIRADNDTNSKYSNWTSIASYTIQDVASGVTNLSISNTEYQGLTFSWTQPNTGWSAVESYKIEYKLSSEETYTSINIADASATSYTIEDIAAGTYDFVVYACTQSGSYCHGGQAGPNTNFIVNQNTATTTTTIPPTLGPPMNVSVAQTYDQGVKVDWDVANSGNLTAETYELYFRTDPKNEIVVYNITETEYTIPYASIPNGDYTFSVRGYSSDDNAYSSFSTEPTLTVFNQKAQDDADAAAQAAYEAEQARIAEEERIAAEKAEEERKAEEARKAEAERIAKEKAEEEARIEAERIAEEERLAEEERIRLKEEARLKELARIEAEAEAKIQKELEESILKDVDTDNLSDDEKKDLKVLVDTIQELQETLEVVEYEEKVFELEEIIIVAPTTTIPPDPIEEIIEENDLLQEESQLPEVEVLTEKEVDQVLEEVLPETITKDDYKEIVKKEIEDLTEDEVEVVVAVTEKAIEKVVDLPTEEIEIIEEEDLEDLSVEEVEAYEEKLEEQVAEVVSELDTEEKVQVVKEVAKVSVQNLANADTTTKAIVKAVVNEVTKVETVATLSEEQKTEVGQVLGFTEEEASEDLTIIANQAAKDENTAQALDEFVERSIASSEVENFTLADVVTEVQVEAFLENPIGELVSVNIDIREMELKSIGADMTSDQKEKAQEVVVPVIIASQIIAQAGAFIRRF